jgi:hypothetical protein
MGNVSEEGERIIIPQSSPNYPSGVSDNNIGLLAEGVTLSMRHHGGGVMERDFAAREWWAIVKRVLCRL